MNNFENKFEDFLMIRDAGDRTFLHYLRTFNHFEIVFDFLRFEFRIDFVRKFLLLRNTFVIQDSINEFLIVLSLFKNNFDEKFVKRF
jgi:hypothetical protein